MATLNNILIRQASSLLSALALIMLVTLIAAVTP